MNTEQDTKTFFENIAKGDLTKIEQLLQSNPSLADATNKQGVSATVFALYNGRTDLAQVLAKIKRKPLDLFEASSLGNYDVVRQILTKNPTLTNSFSPDGFTPLGLASHFGKKEVVELLLSSGAEVNTISKNSTGFTALTGALAGSHREITRLLLQKGANPNHRYEAGFTPIMTAAEGGDVETVKLLLSFGADPSVTAKDGRSAMSIALEKGHREVVELLGKQAAIGKVPS
jgi:ankyrin repeat protein